MHPTVGSGVVLPHALVTDSIKKSLTVRYKSMGATTATIVHGYKDTQHGVLLPRQAGLQLIARMGRIPENCMSTGYRVRFPVNVKHEGQYAYQSQFVARILDQSRQSNDFMVQAGTGKGKTVCALSVIQKIGKSALVIVDQDNLKEQWILQCKNLLGLPDSRIGVVQGTVLKYRGCSVTIAMLQTLVSREYEEDFYSYFGTVVIDEFHVSGAPTFSRALLMFPAVVRFGMSATIDRKDSLQKLIAWSLGDTIVSLEEKHEASRVYFLESDTVYSWYANISPKVGRMLQEVSTDAKRNTLIVSAIKWLFSLEKRDILVVSDRIEQLESLMAECVAAGVPKEVMGLYCGFCTEWKWAKDPTPKRRPAGYVPGTEYTPVAFMPVRKRIPKKDLEKIKEEKQILFATFGMFTKGVDVPRLSAGIDCTPRAKAQQVHGRILRSVPGKKMPIWVTIRDVMSYRLEHQFLSRLREYEASNAEVYEWIMDKGVRRRDVSALCKEVAGHRDYLKAQNIRPGNDGKNTVRIKDSQELYVRRR